MLSLRELQLGFAQEIFREVEETVSPIIRANGLSGARRLQVYRNNMFSSLTGALRAVYPVIERLVGDRFFPYAASEYIRLYPSVSGDLHDFGAFFPAFLATFEATATLSYLPDVALLEWAYHRVFHAAAHAPLDLAALSKIPEESHNSLTFQLHPASRLLKSDYPVLTIWQVNQPDYTGDDTVDLNTGGCKLLMIRRHFDIELQVLTDGEFALLQALAYGSDFATACEQALAIQADFDVVSHFQKHVIGRTLVDFYV